MWFYIKLAWRNIFRNKRRTIIASIAIGIGLASLIFIDAFMVGWQDSSFRSATNTLLGQAQIHGQGFREIQEANLIVKNQKAVLHDLSKEDIVSAFTPRVISLGMITSPADVNSVMLMGVDPRTERQISKIDDAIGEGDFFKGNNPTDIVIGSKLAEMLEVTLGDRLVVTLAQAEGGDLSQDLFRVSGIYRFGLKELDTGMAFIRLTVAQKMLGLKGKIHEIAIKFNDIKLALQEDLPFWKKYSTNGNEAISWTQILPQLKAIFDMTGISRAVMMVILGIVVIFGIINTLFMSLYERLFEFGVLRAIGTRPWGVGKLMLFEAGALGLVSVVVGLVIGGIVNLVFFNVGIDYRGIEFAGSVIQEIIYPVLNWSQFVFYPLGVFLFTFLIGLYPAIVAARMSIAGAMRKSL